MKAMVVGIAWYRRKDYDRLKAMFKDGAELPDTFDSWLKTAETLIPLLTGRGLPVMRAYIDPEAFPALCKAHGMEMDAKARVTYANEYAAKDARSKVKSPRRKFRRR